MKKSVQHLQSIGVYDLWETPKELYIDGCARYSIFPELDVCATDKTSKCRYHYGLQFNDQFEDAFEKPFYTDFFMNPPYSNIEEWMQYAFYEHKRNKVDGLILTFSKTDTKWWHKYVEGYAEVHNIQGRVKFLKDGVPSKNSAPYPSCWIIWRK